MGMMPTGRPGWVGLLLALLAAMLLLPAAGEENGGADSAADGTAESAPVESNAGAAIPTIEKIEEPDNSFCYVCHADYKQEKIASAHLAEGIGCEQCHGPSFDHSEDEDHLTAPDTMYARTIINRACIQCHDQRQLKEGDDGADHELVVEDAATTVDVCTDCHGKHRMKLRSRRWDKASRELVYSGAAVPADGNGEPEVKADDEVGDVDED